jgi:hypothetical protein
LGIEQLEGLGDFQLFCHGWRVSERIVLTLVWENR